MKVVLYTDGASRGNPGISGAGFVLYSEEGEVLFRGAEFLGEGTNNQAEYQALIFGLEKAKELGVKTLTVRLDSELIVRQLSGRYRVKNEGLRSFYLKVKELLEVFGSLKIEHVRRNDNKEADRLANKAIDQR